MIRLGLSPAQQRFVQAVRSRAPASELEAMLDALDLRQRVSVVTSVRGALLAQLFEIAADGAPLRSADIVPDSIPAGATVTFEGRNSLPAFSRFQKRFTRTADGLSFGYNHQPLRAAGMVTGPGYFRVLEAGEDRASELLFDYTRPPPFEPQGWPRYRPNHVGASRFVFMDLHDYVRRVARGVVIGAAFRHGKNQNAYFSLTSPGG